MDATEQFYSDFRLSGRFSLHEEVAEYLIGGIRSGILKGGEKLPSLRDLEKQWGINYCSLKLATALMQERGFVFKQHGRGVFVMPRRETFRRVIVYTSKVNDRPEDNSYYSLLRDFVLAKLRERRIDYVISEDARPEEEHDRIPSDVATLISGGEADAIIGIKIHQCDKKWFYPLPVCKSIGMNIIPVKCRDIMQKLSEYGCRRPALIAPAERKAQGGCSLKERFAAEGLDFPEGRQRLLYPEEELKEHNWGEIGYGAARQLLDRPAELRPDALIVYPDGAVHGVIQAILQLGIDVPGQLRTFFHRNVELGYFCAFPTDYMDVRIETAADILIADLFKNGERN